MAVLSDVDIDSAVKDGSIRIEPYRPEANMGNCSYDVTLGRHYYRMAPHDKTRVYSVDSKGDTESFWGATCSTADPSGHIVLAPGEMILAHTNEFVGGRKDVVPMMKARSSIARWGITVCKCAGWGDVGYTNRWTMEIANHTDAIIQLPIGMRIAQMVFMRTTTPPRSFYVSKYQECDKIDEHSWRPDMMLPKLYTDKRT